MTDDTDDCSDGDYSGIKGFAEALKDCMGSEGSGTKELDDG